MKHVKKIAVVLALTAVSGVTFAQSGTASTARIDQRQAHQQQRIDQGVKSGALTEQEAARLQKGQQRVQNMENKAMADGKMTPKERSRIEHAQDGQSAKIYQEKHDRQHVSQSGGAASASRIDQRQANQQRRIDDGVKSGALTDKEAARLHKGQERVQRMETTAMADGKMTSNERRRIEYAQDRQSAKIHQEKHDRQRK